MQELFSSLKNNNMKLVTAESCTGGLIASSITSGAGASEIFERGFITYSNASKTDCLGVPAALIKKHGAVSPEVAKAMAEGALKNSQADIAIAVTGIAGPNGGSEEGKPIGLVYSAYASGEKEPEVLTHNFVGPRHEIQKQTTIAVIQHLIQRLNKAND